MRSISASAAPTRFSPARRTASGRPATAPSQYAISPENTHETITIGNATQKP